MTFFAERAEPAPEGLRLAKVFVYQEEEDGGRVVVTGEHGLLGQLGDDATPVLLLQQGLRAELPAGRRADDARPSPTSAGR